MADTTEVMESSETIQKIDVTPSQDGGVLKEVSYLTYVFQLGMYRCIGIGSIGAFLGYRYQYRYR